MPENNQASDATKPEATDSSSTQPGSQAVDMNHTNAIVPHQISNHDKLVQTMVMVDGEWVNVNDTNDQKNVQEDMRKVNRVVTEAQKDIINAQNAADSAVKSADSAISASKVNSDTIKAVNSATVAAQSGADAAMSQANDAYEKVSEVSTKADSNAKTIAKAVTQVTTNTANIAATQEALETKVDQTTVDKTNQTVQKLSDQVKTTADQLTSKITKADMTDYVDGKGFATETYAQGLVHQTAHEWGVNLSALTKKVNDNEATTTQNMTHLQASIDGIQTTVINNDKRTKSQFLELSDAVQTKVSQNDYESKISELAGSINLRVKSEDLLSQINLQASNTLIQSGKIYLDAKSALITNLPADQITTGTLKSIQIDNGDGKFTVNPNGDVVANSIKLRNGQFLQGTIAGSTIYALNNNGAQDPKLAPKSDWYKITPNAIRWFNHYDQSVGQIGVGQGVLVNSGGPSEFTGTPGLTISDSAKILLGTAQRTVVTGDEIGNLETTDLDWMSRTNLDITVDDLRVNLDPDQGNEYDGKGAEFSVQKDNKIGAYFGCGDHGNELSITTIGDSNHITFNTGSFDVYGEVHIPNNGLTVKNLHVTRWFGVDGSKNSIVNTSQGTVAINAYETAEYYFGDIGEDQTNGDGKVWVSIDYLFGQTVNTTVPYQVFVTPYSSAHVWVAKRLKNRFLVESDKPSASFAWEIKAKRKGYEHTRLKNVDNMMEKPAGVK